MIKTNLTIYLASKSPRRRKLFSQLGIKFKTFSVYTDELFLDGEHPIQTVKRIASEKMNVASQAVDKGIIITADTIVVINRKIIGKPRNEKDALRILKKLSGKTHTVFTGFVILNKKTNKKVIDYEMTKVTFRKLSEKEIKDYIKTGSPMDKAGAYGIQDDYGAVFVKKIEGCYNNIVGLPLTKIHESLLKVIS